MNLHAFTPRDWLTVGILAVIFAMCFVPLLRRKPVRKPPTPDQRAFASTAFDKMAKHRVEVSERKRDCRGNWNDGAE